MRILILQLIHCPFHHAASKITHKQESNFKRVRRRGKKRHQQPVLLYLFKKKNPVRRFMDPSKKSEISKIGHVQGFVCLFSFLVLFCFLTTLQKV